MNWRPISQVNILINLSKLNIQCKLADFYYIMSNIGPYIIATPLHKLEKLLLFFTIDNNYEIKYFVMCMFI
jgi:hypothetical protein